MKISIISFTQKGRELSFVLQEYLRKKHQVEIYSKKEGSSAAYVKESLREWTKSQFKERDSLIFIGACGIAVRAISPYINHKLEDPAVLVMEETGHFVIPILSGHYGGANELAQAIAEATGAVPVITTATDRNQLFAVDVFAKKNDLVIMNREAISKVSAAVLEHKKITLWTLGDIKGPLPKEVSRASCPLKDNVDIIISPFQKHKDKPVLFLCPKIYVAGMGCKRGKSFGQLERVLKKQADRLGIEMAAVSTLASIEDKKQEKGMIRLAQHYGIEFQTFKSHELNKISGEINGSPFVLKTVGVDNVCERAALAAAGAGGKLVVKKQAEDGITIAIAEKKWSIAFDEA